MQSSTLDVQVRSGGAGAFTADNFPVFDRMLPNVYVAADSNHGYKMIAVGREIARELQGKHSSLLHPFRFERFATGDLHPVSREHPTLCCGDMTIQRMDNVLIVVDDLEAAKAFFAELGMELEGETQVEGPWVDRTIGLNDVHADIAMMRTPDGHGRVELSKFHTPPAVRAEPESAPANALGIRRIMFAVDDIDDVVARLQSHGAELLDEIAQYEDIYRLCFIRGPEGIILGLAERLS